MKLDLTLTSNNLFSHFSYFNVTVDESDEFSYFLIKFL